MSANNERGAVDPKILYLIGAARCGSTVLGMLLAQHPDVASPGELTNTFHMGYLGAFICSCGAPVARCPHWGRVRERLEAELGPDVVTAGARLTRELERHRFVPGLLAGRPPRGFSEYDAIQAGLFRAISAETGAQVVFDTSKWPVRAALLGASREIDLHALHLVRDPRGSVHSRSLRLAKDASLGMERDVEDLSVLDGLVFWAEMNGIGDLVCAHLGGTRLRYEDLVADPRATIAPLCASLGLDLAPLEAVLQGERPFRAEHVIAGGRVRMRPEVRLSLDTRWHREMPRARQVALGLLVAPLLARYRYPLLPRAVPVREG